MSNGLCFLQQSSGFALSRPSCTDLSWDACGEWKYCFNYNPSSGYPIVSATYNGNDTVHCCGEAVYANGTVTCPLEQVSVPYGTAMPGVAGLAVSSTSPSNSSCATETPTSQASSSSSSSSSSRNTAIGAGVGVPLGVIAISALLWAFWERRARMKAISQLAQGTAVNQGDLYPAPQMAYGRPPVELQAPTPSAELGGSSAATELGSEESHKNHV